MAKVKLHSFLFSLAEKAGIDPKDAGLTEILSNQALDNVELSKDLESAINKSLLSVVDAKNNHPEIKTHYFAEIMANVDRSLDDFYREAGLDQKVIDEVSKERSSTKRIALLGTKLKEVIEGASKATKKPSDNEAALNQQINDLNEKLRVEKEGRKADNDKSKGAMNTFKTELNLNNKTGSVKTIYDELPSDVRAISIKNILEKELQDSNASFILDENGSLKLQKKDGSNYFDENNRQLTVDDFINKTLAKNKILKQSAPNSESTGIPPNNGQPPIIPSNGKSKINVDSLMQESFKGLEAEPTKML